MKPKAKAAKVAKAVKAAQAAKFVEVGKKIVDGLVSEAKQFHQSQEMMRFAIVRYERDGMRPTQQNVFTWELLKRIVSHVRLSPNEIAPLVRESADAARLAEARSDSLPF